QRHPSSRGKPARSTRREKGRSFGSVGPGVLTFWFFGKLLAALLALAAAWGAREAVTSSTLNASSVTISGNDLIPAEDIVAALNVGQPNVFQLRSHELAARLDQLPAIESATVQP